jgi:hypothetical protein
MRKLLTAILITLALVATANAQDVKRPVPQFVESLSDADYATWVQWQNRQAERRAEEKSKWPAEPRHDYATQVERRGVMGGMAATRSRTNFNEGGRAVTRFRGGAASITTSRTVRYVNPNYTGPGPITIYNPWVRVKDGKGTPDWDNIFVPAKEGTMTVSELMDTLKGPLSAEKVFANAVSEYFSESEVK